MFCKPTPRPAHSECAPQSNCGCGGHCRRGKGGLHVHRVRGRSRRRSSRRWGTRPCRARKFRSASCRPCSSRRRCGPGPARRPPWLLAGSKSGCSFFLPYGRGLCRRCRGSASASPASSSSRARGAVRVRPRWEGVLRKRVGEILARRRILELFLDVILGKVGVGLLDRANVREAHLGPGDDELHAPEARVRNDESCQMVATASRRSQFDGLRSGFLGGRALSPGPRRW